MKTRKLLLLLMMTFTFIRLFDDVAGAEPRFWRSSVPDNLRNFGLRIPFIPSFIYLPIIRMSETIAFIGLKIASLVMIILIIIALSRKRKGLETKDGTEEISEEPDYGAMWQAYAGLNQGFAYPQLPPTHGMDYYKQSYPVQQPEISWDYDSKEQEVRVAPKKRYRKKYKQPIQIEEPQPYYEEVFPVQEPPRPKIRRPVQKKPAFSVPQKQYYDEPYQEPEVAAVQNPPPPQNQPKRVRRPRPQTRYRKPARPELQPVHQPQPSPRPVEEYNPAITEPKMIRITERPPTAAAVPRGQPANQAYRKPSRPLQNRPRGQRRPRPHMKPGHQGHTRAIQKKPQLEQLPPVQVQTIFERPHVEPVPQIQTHRIRPQSQIESFHQPPVQPIRQRPHMEPDPPAQMQTIYERVNVDPVSQIQTQNIGQQLQMESLHSPHKQTTSQMSHMEPATQIHTYPVRQTPQLEPVSKVHTHTFRKRPQLVQIQTVRQSPQKEPEPQLVHQGPGSFLQSQSWPENISQRPKEKSPSQTIPVYQRPPVESLPQRQRNRQRLRKPVRPIVDKHVLFEQAKIEQQFRPQTLSLLEVNQPPPQLLSSTQTEQKPAQVHIQVEDRPPVRPQLPIEPINNEQTKPATVSQPYPITDSEDKIEFESLPRPSFEDSLPEANQPKLPEPLPTPVVETAEEEWIPQESLARLLDPEFYESEPGPSEGHVCEDKPLEPVKTVPAELSNSTVETRALYPTIEDTGSDFFETEGDDHQDYEEENIREVPEINFPEEKFYQMGDDGLFTEMEFEDEEEQGHDGEILEEASPPQTSSRVKRNAPNEPTNRNMELEDAIDNCTYKMLCEIASEFRNPRNHRDFMDEVFRIFDFTNLKYRLQFIRPTAVVYERAFELGARNGNPFCAETYNNCMIDTAKLRNNLELSP